MNYENFEKALEKMSIFPPKIFAEYSDGHYIEFGNLIWSDCMSDREYTTQDLYDIATKKLDIGDTLATFNNIVICNNWQGYGFYEIRNFTEYYPLFCISNYIVNTDNE